MVSEMLASATAVPVQNVGWSYAAIMGAVQNVILLALGGGGGGLLLRAIVQLKRIGNERAKQEDDREGARWHELMELNGRLQSRVERLETDLRDERRRCDDDVASIRKQHADEIRALYERIEQMQRTFLQGQASTVALLASNSTTHAKDAAERMGKHLRDAHDQGEGE